jgi:hypothetical protein
MFEAPRSNLFGASATYSKVGFGLAYCEPVYLNVFFAIEGEGFT